MPTRSPRLEFNSRFDIENTETNREPGTLSDGILDAYREAYRQPHIVI